MINLQSCVGLNASMLLLSIPGASIAMVKKSVAPKAKLQNLDLQTIQASPKPAKKQSSRRNKQFRSIYLSAIKYCDLWYLLSYRMMLTRCVKQLVLHSIS